VVFQNLNIQTKIKYVFDPATFCQNNNLDITNSFDLQVEKVDFSKYYSYEGNNPDNVDVDEDLSKLFQVSNSPFAVQFKSYVFPLIKTDLGKLIVQEFQRLYCVTDNSSSREEKFVTAFERYTRKMDILQRLGLIYMLNKN
jgi:Ca2+-binding EF-hand superfamily protein